MPRESIGVCGTQSEVTDWNTAELEIGICYIKHACGEPPLGFELEIVWHEHELGDYPTIGLSWDGPVGAPWEYISRAERALERLNDAVEWSALGPEEDTADQEEENGLEPEDDESNESATGQGSLFAANPGINQTPQEEYSQSRTPPFVSANELSFDVEQTIQLAIADWEATKAVGPIPPNDESIGDFISAEMESTSLRCLNSETAWFNAEADPGDFRTCVFRALDRWLVEAGPTKRSLQEIDEYHRQCGE